MERGEDDRSADEGAREESGADDADAEPTSSGDSYADDESEAAASDESDYKPGDEDGSETADTAETAEHDDSGGSGGSSDSSDADDQAVTAPSVGPNTEFNHEMPEERLARHEQSTEDAMGNDKRREVVGGSYGAGKRRQLVLYGAFLAVVVALVIGARFAISEFDKPRESRNADTAPWAELPKNKQVPAKPISFPRNGTQQLEVPDSGVGGTENAE
ncbi:MAG: hypothetical protein H0W09_03245 [Solirubrobacterales bacterium]|nr:hypothetical protein [Solirubrobacterales bacterium]